MIANTPLQIDGETFDRYSLNLAIASRYNPDGTADASINLLLTPTRIAPATEDDEGNPVPAHAEQAPQAARSFLRGRLSEVTDADEQAAIAAIRSALQTYVAAKGL